MSTCNKKEAHHRTRDPTYMYLFEQSYKKRIVAEKQIIRMQFQLSTKLVINWLLFWHVYDDVMCDVKRERYSIFEISLFYCFIRSHYFYSIPLHFMGFKPGKILSNTLVGDDKNYITEKCLTPLVHSLIDYPSLYFFAFFLRFLALWTVNPRPTITFFVQCYAYLCNRM